MFEKIFSEYSMLALCVIAGIVIMIGMFFPSLKDLGTSLTGFMNSYNN